MKTLLRTLFLLLAALPTFAQQGQIVQSPAYKECIALASSNPQQALSKADEWLKIDNGISAHHCQAMAFYGLRRYEEAGAALTAIRKMVPPENVTLRTFVTKQAMTAWLNANKVDAALDVVTSQITDMNTVRGNNMLVGKQTAELLLERAKLNTTYGKFPLAIQDLDHAVSLTPLNTDLLTERAHTFELMGDAGLARQDAESALKLNADNSKARALLARLDAKMIKPMVQ